MLDTKGRHAHKCAAGGDRTRRHHAARNGVGRLADDAGANPELEKPGLLQPNPDQPNAGLRRPADVYPPTWFGSMPAALDLAVV